MPDDKQPSKRSNPKLAVAKQTAAVGADQTGQAKTRAARQPVNDTRKIHVVAKENPHRPGTKAYRTFAQYKSNITVAEWKAAVLQNDGDPGYLSPDIKAGLIKVTSA